MRFPPRLEVVHRACGAETVKISHERSIISWSNEKKNVMY